MIKLGLFWYVQHPFLLPCCLMPSLQSKVTLAMPEMLQYFFKYINTDAAPKKNVQACVSNNMGKLAQENRRVFFITCVLRTLNGV
jgi:hypothetical protein